MRSFAKKFICEKKLAKLTEFDLKALKGAT